jgi:hypothetical protein
MSEEPDEPHEIESGLTPEEALEDLRRFAEKFPATKAAIKEITPEEMGALLFVATGPDVLIQAMHYPDSALDMTVIPNLFPSTEKGKIIAAFPDSLMMKIMKKIEESYDESYKDYMWQKSLGLLLETVVEMIDTGEIKQPDWNKLI